MADPNSHNLGIIVAGGPAPGINAVIGAATIEACNRGFNVTGFYDGFKWLVADDFDPTQHTTNLTIPKVARIHFDGGSILRTARASLLDKGSKTENQRAQPDTDKIRRVVARLRELDISHLITIGGDDTALSARFVSENDENRLRIAHIPKTIDNDLPLPPDTSTFGFSTARYYGTEIVKNLMQDSLTTGRWYLVTVMGRTAGFLAHSIGMSASATATLIPEEFPEKLTIHAIANVIEGAMFKRRAMGRHDGVVVVAEGLAGKLGDHAELERMLGTELPVDDAGHIRLADIPLGLLLRREVESRFKARGDAISMVTHVLGYELRSADPTPFDMSYCRTLGHGAVQWLLTGSQNHAGAMITVHSGELHPVHFTDMIDPETNRIRVRLVDINSQQYRVARSYMLRLEQSDLQDPDTLNKLANAAGTTPSEFKSRYNRAATRLPDLRNNPR